MTGGGGCCPFGPSWWQPGQMSLGGFSVSTFPSHVMEAVGVLTRYIQWLIFFDPLRLPFLDRPVVYWMRHIGLDGFFSVRKETAVFSFFLAHHDVI